ncbi:MAG: ATP-binding cassette domain-containing protein [Woeseia sp.]
MQPLFAMTTSQESDTDIMIPENQDAPLIDIQRATIWRGSTRVFHEFNLLIPQHQQVAILGPNGAGKTTLLKLINREIYPVADPAATVRILGRDNWNVWDLRAHIGLVSQDLQNRYRAKTRGLQVVVSGFLSSVGVHGLLARRVTPEQLAKARSAMQELGVLDLAETPLANMSTGQQRRCLLARALVHEPHTLILDEPTAGLDLAASFDYLARMRDLVRAGKNVVLVTHAVHEIPPAIGRVILLRAGRIVADGPRATVLTRDNLEAAFGVPVRVREIDGYFLAYPERD